MHGESHIFAKNSFLNLPIINNSNETSLVDNEVIVIRKVRFSRKEFSFSIFGTYERNSDRPTDGTAGRTMRIWRLILQIAA